MWLDNFNEMRRASGLSLDELSEKSGVPKGTLAKITSGITKAPALETIRSLVYAMGYTLNELEDDVPLTSVYSRAENEMIKKYRALDEHGKTMVDFVLDNEKARCDDMVRDQEPVLFFPLSRYIQSASAGTGDFTDDSSYETVYLVKQPPAGVSFLITVNGDSMEPTFYDGDILFVRAQETILIGQIGLFVINGHLFVKELGKDGLISHNDKYPLITPSEYDTFKVEGRILGVCTEDYFK